MTGADVAGIAALEAKFCCHFNDAFSIPTLLSAYSADVGSSFTIDTSLTDLASSKCNGATYTFSSLPSQATADASTGKITLDTTELFYAPSVSLATTVEGRSVSTNTFSIKTKCA